MKKRLWVSWIIIVVILCLFFVFHDNKWNESLLNQEEKINYSEYIDLSTSEIKTSIIQKTLSDNWILKTWNNLYYNKDLDRITKLAIELPKNSVKELDLSELKYLRNLKSLNIYWKYEFIQTQEWSWESVW